MIYSRKESHHLVWMPKCQEVQVARLNHLIVENLIYLRGKRDNERSWLSKVFSRTATINHVLMVKSFFQEMWTTFMKTRIRVAIAYFRLRQCFISVLASRLPIWTSSLKEKSSISRNDTEEINPVVKGSEYAYQVRKYFDFLLTEARYLCGWRQRTLYASTKMV